MIPVSTDQKKLIDSRKSHVLCHPKYTNKKLHGDEKLFTVGDVTMLSTPIECGKVALITDTWVACAISDDNQIVINPNGNMYPELAECINAFLTSENIEFFINKFKWTIGDYAVGADKTIFTSNGVPVTQPLDAVGLKNKRNQQAKLIKFYVENVMDAVYNTYKGSGKETLWKLFSPAHNAHSEISLNWRPSFENEDREKTLESLVFNYDMVSALAGSIGVAESGLSIDGTRIKQSTAKRLLSSYISNRLGVPYIPIKFSELQREVVS